MIDYALRDQLKDVHAYALTIYQGDDLYALDLEGFARNIAWAADRGVRVFVVGPAGLEKTTHWLRLSA